MKLSLSTLSEATEQEVFDHVARHLLRQGHKAFVNSVGVVYRNQSNGDACALGCLMNDQEYQPTFEALSWPMLVSAGLVPGAHWKLMYALQVLHDEIPTDEWKTRLARLAGNYRLNADVLKEFE